MAKKSMTEAEAIEVIRKAIEFSIGAVKGLDKSKDKIEMVELACEYYESKENCEQEVAACMLAIKALKEIQEYRAIGTVEDLKRLYYLRQRYEDETYDYCGEYGTSECGARAQLERLKVYEEIGTVEAVARVVKLFSVDADGHTITEKLDMLAEYKKIGTLEECRQAREKQKAKKVGVWGDGVGDDGEILYDMYTCPNCEKDYENDYHDYEYCPECGQRMDRSET